MNIFAQPMEIEVEAPNSPIKKFKRLKKRMNNDNDDNPFNFEKNPIEGNQENIIANQESEVQLESGNKVDRFSKMNELINEVRPFKAAKEKKQKTFKRVPKDDEDFLDISPKKKRVKSDKNGIDQTFFESELNKLENAEKKVCKKDKPIIANISNQDLLKNFHENPLFTMEDDEADDTINESRIKEKVVNKSKRNDKLDKAFKVKTRNKFLKTIDIRENQGFKDSNQFYDDFGDLEGLQVESNFIEKKRDLSNFLNLFGSPTKPINPLTLTENNDSNNSKATTDTTATANSNEKTTDNLVFQKPLERGSGLSENLISSITQQFGKDYTGNAYLKIQSFAANSGLHSNTLYLKKMFKTNSLLHQSLIENKGVSAISPSPNKKQLSNREDFKRAILGNMKRRVLNFETLENLGQNFQETRLDELAKKISNSGKENNENIDNDEEDEDYNPEAIDEEVSGKGLLDSDNDSDDSEEMEINKDEDNKLLSKDFKIPEGVCIEEYLIQKKLEEDKFDDVINDSEEEHGQMETESIDHSKSQYSNESEDKLEIEDSQHSKEGESFHEEDIANDNEESDEEVESDISELHSPKPKRIFKKLRKANQPFIKAKKEKTWKEIFKAPEDLEKEKRIKSMFFETEAELGSDNEENDENIKEINKDDEAEYDGAELDEEFKELIDNVTRVREGEEEELWNKFSDDILKQDKENLLKVLRGAYNINKKNGLDINIDENEEMKKKLKMIEERIKMLEEQDNIYGINNTGQQNPGNLQQDYESDPEIEEFEVPNPRIKNRTKFDFGNFLEADVMNLLDSNSGQMQVIEDPEFPKGKYQNNKTSVLLAKTNSQEISQFNNNFNKDVINEFGHRNQSKSGVQEGNSNLNLQRNNSLNKIFMESHKQINKSNSNKIFLFRNHSHKPMNSNN